MASKPEIIRFARWGGVSAIILLLPLLGRAVALVLTLALLGRCAYELYGSLRLLSPALRTAVCSAYMLLGTAFLCFAIAPPLKSISYACMIVLGFSLGRWGALAALAAAILLRDGLSLLDAVGIWGAIAAAALAGAAAASWVKRRSGVKGFGRSGNSGVLDYFDGFLFAAPVALAVLSR